LSHSTKSNNNSFSRDLLEYTARCIETSGSRDFFDPFFEMLHTFYGVDQVMVFFLNSSSRFDCLLSRNFTNKITAESLAKAYIDEGYRSDPNLSSLKNLSPGETKAIHLRDVEGDMAKSYREAFFSKPHLTDKVSILTADETGRYFISLYRSSGRSSFIEQGLFIDPIEARLLAAIVTQHYRLKGPLNGEDPLDFLSDRERQICQGILQGKKMDAISAEIGIASSSVITYKKRAYIKLGINSRTSLFELCNKH